MSIVVMGVGFCGAFPTSSGWSYREMIKRAATMAYQDAGITPEEVDGAVSVEEDLISGYSISDEYVPDQLGMVRKPVYTIPGDFLHGIASPALQLKTGRFKTVLVQSYSKASNILTKEEILNFAYHPVYNRFGVTPHFLAALEMQNFLTESEYEEFDIAEVAARNRRTALTNPLAPYGANINSEDILNARPVSTPLTEEMIAKPADAAVVVILGIGPEAEERVAKPVYLTGTGWGSGTSLLERRDLINSIGTEVAAKLAFEEAGIENPAEDIDLFYISDLYPHRQLIHMEAIGLNMNYLPRINPDGGTQGGGELFEATGGARFFDAVRMLRGEAGAHQRDDVERILVHGWRGLPTDSCAVAILEAESF